MQGGSLRAVLAAVLLVGGLHLASPGQAQYGGWESPFIPPTADFTWSPQTPAAGQRVLFRDTSDPGEKGIGVYEWEWGDGTNLYRSRVVKNVTHVFAQPGTYQVTHTVTDRAGSADSKTKSVTILPALKPALQVTREGAAVSVDASASSSPNGRVVSYRIEWGDGTPDATTARATHAYAHPGNYTVNLTITDSLGGEGYAQAALELTDAPPAVAFAVEPARALVGEEVRFSDTSRAGFYALTARAWRVDGEAAGSASVLARTFTTPGWRNVTLAVTDARGQTAEVTRALRVLAPPEASFNLTLDERDVSVQANATDADGQVARYEWDWGDGAVPSTGTSASHRYQASGAYNVTLTVTDDDGLRATVVKQVEIQGRPVVVAFDVSPQPARPGHEVRFLDGSVDPEGPLQRWSWELGDGGIAEGAEVVHIYAAPGRYVVNLTVTDSTGGLARASRTVVVEAPPPPTPVSTTPATTPPTATTPTGGTPSTPATTPTTPDPVATTATTPDVTRQATTPAAPSAKNPTPSAGLAALVLAAAAALLVLRRR